MRTSSKLSVLVIATLLMLSPVSTREMSVAGGSDAGLTDVSSILTRTPTDFLSKETQSFGSICVCTCVGPLGSIDELVGTGGACWELINTECNSAGSGATYSPCNDAF